MLCFQGTFEQTTFKIFFIYIFSQDLKTVCTKCPFLFSGKKKKSLVNLLSAEIAKTVVKVKTTIRFADQIVVSMKK